MRALALAVLACALSAAEAAQPAFSFFAPAVTITDEDRRVLAEGEPISRMLPSESREIAVFAAIPIRADGDRLVEWVRAIDRLKRSSFVLAIHRFSDPPTLQDLQGLVLDADELSEVRACSPQRCSVKLTTAEIDALREADARDRKSGAALQEAFRRIILTRTTSYLAGVEVASFERLIEHSTFLTEHAPWLVADLASARATSAGGESFLYWSKERLAGKAAVSVTDVRILRGNGHDGVPDALVVGKQLFATHYINRALAVTAVVDGEAGGTNYLVYLNRSDVDAVGGPLFGIVRWAIGRRLRGEAADVLRGLRTRLESGPPG